MTYFLLPLTEISYQEGSVYNSEINLTNPDAECQTDPLEETDYSHAEMDNNFVQETTEELKLNENANKGQVEVSFQENQVYFFFYKIFF